jgi:hypothetical protein
VDVRVLGFYHGAIQVLHRLVARWYDPLPRVVRQLTMFLLAVVGWVFFRATSFEMAAHILGVMFSPSPGAIVGDPLLATLGIAVAAWWAMVGPNAFDLHYGWSWRRGLVYSAAFGAALALIAGSRPSPFLYFQF